MQINVVPEVVTLVGATYLVKLRGTALLSEQARGWIKQAGRWRVSRTDAGQDIHVAVRQADPDEGPATRFELQLKWTEDRPGHGPTLWGGSYQVRDAGGERVLEQMGASSSSSDVDPGQVVWTA
jgi:hypothetical protein